MTELSPLVARLLSDNTLTEEQRRKLAVFHGQWNTVSEPTLVEQAQIAWQRCELDHPSLQSEQVPALLRAQAALARGEPQEAVELLDADQSLQGAVVRAEALVQLGQMAAAVSALSPWRNRLTRESLTEATDLTAAAQALVLLARLEGRPSQDYQLAVQMLAKAHQEINRLYWPAMLAEAGILLEKDNAPEAIQALQQTLTLNPGASQAWQMLGEIALGGYNFDQVDHCLARLRQIHTPHLLADLLEARKLLTQNDPRAAEVVLVDVLQRHPRQREAWALHAAAEALRFDQTALERTLRQYDELSPGSALAWFTVGKILSMARQYGAGEAALRQAIDRYPNWPAPHIELGLMLMQSGDEPQAREALRHAVRLDPFNRRAQNQLKLVEELLGYEQIATEHFVIKYRKGVDEVLARDMPDTLEKIYQDVTTVFGHKPARPTLIEIMPDEKWFAVRITGMPWIWTIGACTGDVIALTPPRQGTGQRGPFDWATVLGHEFVHTVTLDQTGNRIPHWFTEACAVSQEPYPRDYASAQLLASALHANKLFNLDQINWAFIRPKTPADRPLAYAQAHWMLEYITHQHGHQAVVRMLEAFHDAVDTPQAIQASTGQSAEALMRSFKSWAREQVRLWGLEPLPEDAQLQALLAHGSQASPAEIHRLLERYPRQPDLLRLAAEQALGDDDWQEARRLVLRYAAARPVDPWSFRALLKLTRRADEMETAIGALEHLDHIDVHDSQWAVQLAKLHRGAGDLEQAMTAMERALRREPYNPAIRELAATIALQNNDRQTALRHLQAMILLEPGQSLHWVRLAALHQLLGHGEQADHAARKARELDPNAPISRFLKE